MKSLKELRANILSKDEIHEEKLKFVLMKFKTGNTEDIDDRLNSLLNNVKSAVSTETKEIMVVLKCISDKNNEVDHDEIKDMAKREGFTFVDSSMEEFNESDVELQEARVAEGYLFATDKDVERASELNSSGRSF